MNRMDAIRQGLQIYEPDQPCRNGHRRRYASTGQCADCMSDTRKTLSATMRAAQFARTAIDSGLVAVVSQVHPNDVADLAAYVCALSFDRQMSPAAPLVGGLDLEAVIAGVMDTYKRPATVWAHAFLPRNRLEPALQEARRLCQLRGAGVPAESISDLPDGRTHVQVAMHPEDAPVWEEACRKEVTCG